MWTINPDRRQRGFSIPAAIFIVVILAALGAFMVTVGSGQQLGHAQDVTGSKVLQAARSGLDWGIYQVLNTTAVIAPPASTNFRGKCDNNDVVNLPMTITLPEMAGITISVNCSSVSYQDGATTFHTYLLTAYACNNGTCPNTSATLPNLYVERRLSMMVTN